MKSSKSICIVSPSLRVGGIERALTVLANFLSRKNFKVTFLACLAGQRFYHLEDGVQIVEPDFRHSGNYVSKLVYYPKIILFIRRIVTETKPDKVLVFGDLFSPIVLLSLLGMNYPVYISDRTSPDFKLKSSLKLLKQWLYPKSTGFIAQTNRAAGFKKMQFGDNLNIRVIPNAIREIELFSEIKREKVILYVGRLSWEKGPKRLLLAFNNIPNRDGWQLHLAGTGPLFDNLQRLVRNLSLQKEVSFLGNVGHIDEIYASASIYVLPSLMEGFPNALCEAMAAGLPCICFDTIPYEEIFTNGVDGLAVKGDDINALSSALMMLMENEQLRKSMGSEAQKITTRLNVEKVGQQVMEFIFER